MTTKKPRKIHTDEFKEEAVKLANQIGVTAAAKRLGVNASQISKWRSKTQNQSTPSQREAKLAAEVAKLKRQLAEQAEDLSILKKAATYFAKNQK